MRVGEIVKKRLMRILIRTVLCLLIITLVLVVSLLIWIYYFFDPMFDPGPYELSPYQSLERSLVESIPELQWTSDGDRIVFTFTDRKKGDLLGERRLYVLASDASEILSISDGVHGTEIVDSLTISPDGDRIAFSRLGYTANTVGNPHIYTSSLDGSDQRKLTDEDRSETSPVWSPTDDRIAFVLGPSDGRAFPFITHMSEGIYTIDGDGSDIRKVVDTRPEKGGVTYPNSLTWSPDGRLLAFFGRRDDDVHTPWQFVIYAVKADGSGLTPLFTPSQKPTEVSFISLLAWSPDSQRVAFVLSEYGKPKLYTVGLDGAGLRLVAAPEVTEPTPLERTSGSVAWSPDGSQILFSLGRASDLAGIREPELSIDFGYYSPAVGSLYIVDADGTNPRNVGLGMYSVWSPDGSQIASIVPAGDEFSLYTIASDGSDIRVLVRRRNDGILESVVAEDGQSQQ